MQYSVIIPTNRSIASLLPTLQSLQAQTISAKQIILVYDKILTQDDYDTIIQVIHQNLQAGMIERVICMTHLTHDFQPGKGVSYMRNKGIHFASADYILCIDDDNTIASDFVERLGNIASLAQEKYKRHSLLIPTEYHKNTLRSRGYV
jgi:glycosyltransferase involved in cell wall biosynthesis